MLRSALGLTKALRRNSRGSIAPIFAAALPLLLVMAGVAIDYSRAFSSRTAIQSALDAAVFGAARASVMNDEDPKVVIKQFFDETVAKKFGIDIDAVVGSKGANDVFIGTASGKVKTSFMQIAGTKEIDISVRSEVIFGIGSAEVALVLDATDSMAGSKISTLKTAAKDLVDVLYSTPQADKNVKVAVVPFARYVNVGLGNRYASWIDVPADYSQTNYVCTKHKPIIDKQGCRTETGTGSKDGVPYTYNYEVCDSYTYGPEEEKCGDQTSSYKWNGCVGSRANPLDTKDDSYTTRIPGLLNTWCPPAISPLSKSKSSIKSDIDAMTTSGDTYVPSGLAWGWRVLSNKAPYDEAANDPDIDPSSPPVKYLVLMTDGANTRSPNYPDHNGNDATKANTLTTQLCNNIKADKVHVFTIAFEVSDTTIKDLLQNCATSTADFFDASNGTQLLSAFKSIGESMTQVRLHK